MQLAMPPGNLLLHVDPGHRCAAAASRPTEDEQPSEAGQVLAHPSSNLLALLLEADLNLSSPIAVQATISSLQTHNICFWTEMTSVSASNI